MMTLLSAAVIAAAILWSARSIGADLRGGRDDARRARSLALMQTFSAAAAAARSDPRALLLWQPLAAMARTLFPDEFAALDRAFGGAFPFAAGHIEAAHAQWTTEWLAWERTHDAQYRMKAAEAERGGGDSAVVRARLDAIEREKLDLYQRRYEEYIRVAKALQALTAT